MACRNTKFTTTTLTAVAAAPEFLPIHKAGRECGRVGVMPMKRELGGSAPPVGAVAVGRGEGRCRIKGGGTGAAGENPGGTLAGGGC